METGETSIVTSMSLKMRAIIVKYDNGTIIGELHSRYLDAPYVFSDLVNMIHKMEEIFDTKGFPQAFLSPRSFENGKRTVRNRGNGESPRVEPQNLEGAQKCSFDISVRFRQNATWQGEIVWIEKNINQDFRSVLEMLKLIDEALAVHHDSSTPVDCE